MKLKAICSELNLLLGILADPVSAYEARLARKAESRRILIQRMEWVHGAEMVALALGIERVVPHSFEEIIGWHPSELKKFEKVVKEMRETEERRAA